MAASPPGGYSHNLGIDGRATLMGGFLKKFAPMMGALLGIPAPMMGYLFGNFTSTWGKKWPFPFKMTQFLPIMGGFYANLAPMMGAFIVIRRGGRSCRRLHIHSNFPSKYPPKASQITDKYLPLLS